MRQGIIITTDPSELSKITQNNVQGIILKGHFANQVNPLGRYTSEDKARDLCHAIQEAQFHVHNSDAITRNLKRLTDSRDKKLSAFAAIAVDLKTRFEAVAQQFADQHNIAGYRITLNPTILSRRRSYEQPGWDRISLLSSYVKTRSSRLLLGDDLWENGDMVLFKGWATTRQANNDADDLLRYSNTLEGAIDKTGIGLSISMTPDFSKKYT